jgi:translin
VELTGAVAATTERLVAAHQAREQALGACRGTIRAAASSIRAVHRLDPERAAALATESEQALRVAQRVLADHPAIYHAGFLHDAAKEYVEARVTAALVAGIEVPSADELGVDGPAWLNGVAEAASELRRHALDRLRHGDLDAAERLLGAMDDTFGALVAIDLPDAVTGGLRRTLDALRAVLERTRGDITTAVLQTRLQRALERGLEERS